MFIYSCDHLSHDHLSHELLELSFQELKRFKILCIKSYYLLVFLLINDQNC